MVSLDNLVVTMALPVIRHDLGASLADLEWTVNAYTLTFAALLLTGAALGDRFGRRRMFTIGLAIFTVGSAGAALSPHRHAHPRPRDPGCRRRDRDAAQPDDPLRRRPARSAGRSPSAPGAASPASRSRSGRSSAAPSRRASRGTGSSGSTCRSGSSLILRARPARESHGPDRALDLPGVGARQRRPGRHRAGA